MLNEALYMEMEKTLRFCHIQEEAEDILLELAEELADLGCIGKERIVNKSYGKTKIEACGVCTKEEDEIQVMILWMIIAKKKFDIQDCFL